MAGLFGDYVAFKAGAYADPSGVGVLSNVAFWTNIAVGAAQTVAACTAALVLPPATVIAGAISTYLSAAAAMDECQDVFRKEDEKIATSHPITSVDPNDKVGSSGSGVEHWISSQEFVKYTLFFENLETATAPAQEVVIGDKINLERLDASTFGFGPIAFGNRLITPPQGLKDFTTDVDLRPEKNILVRINAHLNMGTGTITWSFVSLDPATGQPIDDPLLGFLPPNVNAPEGEGQVNYMVKPRQSLATGTQIGGPAVIVFDTNDPVFTPSWMNTMDNSSPESQVASLSPTQSQVRFPVAWSGSDGESGVQSYTVLVSDNGGPFVPWVEYTSALADSFDGQYGHTYRFYSIARDLAGNIEDTPPTPDVTTRVTAPFVANAGQDTTAECSSSAGAEVTLDGSGSTDPDNDSLTFTWREEGNVIAGPTANPTVEVALGFGEHIVELTVDDGQGGIDTDEVVIRVVDTTAPTVVALLIPQVGTDEGVYRVRCNVSDVCDSTPQLLHLDINSISVSDGQLVTLRAGDEFKYRTVNGMLEMQGNRLILRCTAQDASENIGIGQTTPVVTARGKGFWAHQFRSSSSAQFDGDVLSSETEDGVTYFRTMPKGADRGHSVADSVHEPTQNLIAYLNTIRNEFEAFDWLIDERVGEDNYERISNNVSALLAATGKSMRLKAECHVLALLLDLAANRLARNTVVSPDDLLLDALDYLLPVLTDSSASKNDLERVKDIADAISNGELLADADLIPGDSLPGLLVTGERVSEIEKKPTSAPLPREFAVSQSYPNPFNPMATITYALPTEGKVTIEIYDIVGRKVVTLLDATEQAGYHSVVWYGEDTTGNSVASGVYFCRVQFGNKADVKKMILLR
jgi:hypothetical protein